mmetsp:Transcript_22922/g.58192  ORF Transcript_22922/g.58192 Transcript_22922/m.58192 type:complete len:228 (-) Transcript_22922:37-720(-)
MLDARGVCAQPLADLRRSAQLALVVEQLEYKPIARPGRIPFLLHERSRLEQAHAVRMHEEGEHERDRARERRHAVDDHVSAVGESCVDGLRNPLEIALGVACAALGERQVRLSAGGRSGLALVEILTRIGIILEVDGEDSDAISIAGRQHALARRAVDDQPDPGRDGPQLLERVDVQKVRVPDTRHNFSRRAAVGVPGPHPGCQLANGLEIGGRGHRGEANLVRAAW